MQFHCSGHIVFSLPGCKQLLSMFVWEKNKKKCFDHHWFPGWDFFSGNVSFARLSNSVLVGCFKFQRSMGCKTSSFLLSTVPASSFDFLFSFALRRCSFLLTRGRVHKNSNIFVTKKCEWTCGLREGGNARSVALFRARCSSGIPNVAAARDYFNRCSAEYKVHRAAFQGDYSININGGKRVRDIYKDYIYIYKYIYACELWSLCHMQFTHPSIVSC